MIVNNKNNQTLYSNLTSSEAENKLKELQTINPFKTTYKIESYATGGTVRQNDGIKLDKQISNGDDRLVAVKPGEGILTPYQNEAWQNISQIVPQLDTYLADMIKLPDYSKNVTVNPPSNTINYTGGDVYVQGNLDNVTLKDVEKTVNKQVERVFDKFTRAALP